MISVIVCRLITSYTHKCKSRIALLAFIPRRGWKIKSPLMNFQEKYLIVNSYYFKNIFI